MGTQLIKRLFVIQSLNLTRFLAAVCDAFCFLVRLKHCWICVVMFYVCDTVRCTALKRLLLVYTMFLHLIVWRTWSLSGKQKRHYQTLTLHHIKIILVSFAVSSCAYWSDSYVALLRFADFFGMKNTTRKSHGLMTFTLKRQSAGGVHTPRNPLQEYTQK